MNPTATREAHAIGQRLKSVAKVEGDEITLSRDDLQSLMMDIAKATTAQHRRKPVAQRKAQAAPSQPPSLDDDIARITRLLAMPGVQGWANVNGLDVQSGDAEGARDDGLPNGFAELLAEDLGALAASKLLRGELVVRYAGHETVLRW